MLKRLFQFSSNGHGSAGCAEPAVESELNGSSGDEWKQGQRAGDAVPAPGGRAAALEKSAGFEQIYQNAAVKAPPGGYSILRVAEMLNSPHLAGMTAELRRCALLMALEAAHMDTDQLLQDAMLRQRALNGHEDTLRERLRGFEAARADENRAIQAELDRVTSQQLARIQMNLDSVAGAQDEFQNWQERKQRECQRISDAAGFCVPQGGAAGLNGLAAVLEQASRPRR